MEYFYVEEENLGDQKFRFLTWMCSGSDDEDFSVVPENVALEIAVEHIKSCGVQQNAP